MAHDVEDDDLTFDIVTNSVIPHSISPLADSYIDELLATVWIGLNPPDRLQHLTLDSFGKFAEVIFKPPSRDKTERSHLAGSGVDGPK